ncbi:hypothetical protein [Sandaracinus amylolyticus]|uniref:hypothetical protein n=1 Tax=Sandaracinus amylolyticus TaxID=927083 RepID=UPI001F172828|nr:hypothetical protein [Sandaracinus amylolyticus]UJR83949.1 Hypothetical protein I5071_60200 [Sandaracinus amylolyticus]
MLRLVISGLVALVIATFATSARAQTPSDEQARTHFESGRLYFERGEYDAALREFEAAYELSHRTQLLYNIYLTLERLGRPGDAADRLEAFVAASPELDDEARANFETRIANLRARAAELAREEEARAAREREATPVAPPEEGIGTLGMIGIGGLAAGGASLLAFAITGGLAAAEDSSLADSCGENAGRTCTEDDVSTLRTLTTTADVTLAIGLVLAAAGGTLLAIDLATTEQAPVAIAPMIGPSVAGVQIGGAL